MHRIVSVAASLASRARVWPSVWGSGGIRVRVEKVVAVLLFLVNDGAVESVCAGQRFGAAFLVGLGALGSVSPAFGVRVGIFVVGLGLAVSASRKIFDHAAGMIKLDTGPVVAGIERWS